MGYLGENIGKLGFGLMRLPSNGDKIDIEQTKIMVDKFLAAGFTYFDTAYVYTGSEEAIREALVRRHPRDSFRLASKMPLWSVEKEEDYEPLFQESYKRAGVDYFDFYLLHNMTDEQIDRVERTNGWSYVKKLKADGRVKHIGFSYHGMPEALDEVLAKHPEVEFVQLQVNYSDWENPRVRSRECVETCRRHSVPVIIMEPVKGGSLAGLNEDIRSIFTSADPNASVASWAVRFCASLDGVITVLSGMSNIEQMEDNLSYMKDFRPLSDSERAIIDKVVAEMAKIPQVACTACRYCVEGCPQSIDIPGIFRGYNDFLMYANKASFKGNYARVTEKGGKASDCIECGSCEERCPQHLEIRELLKKVAAAVE